METCIRHTTLGDVRGYNRDGVIKYLGIPYAKPPVGPLRFRRSVANDPWEGVFDAADFGEASCQIDRGAFKGSEDCLFVNIMTPDNTDPSDRLPVYVFIHGGGYNTGATSDPLLDGSAFAKDGVIFVSFQYRLNVLGFYDFTLCKGGEAFDSNCGLSDMVLALHWIHDNIASFGGDPDNITIGGESAGGGAVLTLMAVPAVKGLFAKVIAESGVPVCLMTKEIAKRNTDLFLEGMGWTEDDVPKLLTISPEDMQKGNSFVAEQHQYRNPGIYLPSPVIDDLLPLHPIEAIENGSAADVSLIIGTNLHEGAMFVRREATNFPNSWSMIADMFEKNSCTDRLADMVSWYDPQTAEELTEITLDALREMKEPPAHMEDGIRAGDARVFINFATDHAFVFPAIKVADAQKKNTDKVWMYRYEFVSESGLATGMGACHAFELPAVFAVRDNGFGQFIFGQDSQAQESLIRAMHGSWVRFMKTGDPGETWGPYAGHHTPIRIFDADSRTENVDLEPFMELWNGLHFYEE